MTVLARSGDRAAALELVTLSAGRSGSALLTLLRLDLGTDPPRTPEDLGRALVALARELLSANPAPDAPAVLETSAAETGDDPGGQRHRRPAAWQDLSTCRTAEDEAYAFAASCPRLRPRPTGGAPAARAVSRHDLDLGDRTALRDLAITSLRDAAHSSDRLRVVCGTLLFERFQTDHDEADLNEAAALLRRKTARTTATSTMRRCSM